MIDSGSVLSAPVPKLSLRRYSGPWPQDRLGRWDIGFGLRAWPLALVRLWQDDVDLVSLMS